MSKSRPATQDAPAAAPLAIDLPEAIVLGDEEETLAVPVAEAEAPLAAPSPPLPAPVPAPLSAPVDVLGDLSPPLDAQSAGSVPAALSAVEEVPRQAVIPPPAGGAAVKGPAAWEPAASVPAASVPAASVPAASVPAAPAPHPAVPLPAAPHPGAASSAAPDAGLPPALATQLDSIVTLLQESQRRAEIAEARNVALLERVRESESRLEQAERVAVQASELTSALKQVQEDLAALRAGLRSESVAVPKVAVPKVAVPKAAVPKAPGPATPPGAPRGSTTGSTPAHSRDIHSQPTRAVAALADAPVVRVDEDLDLAVDHFFDTSAKSPPSPAGHPAPEEVAAGGDPNEGAASDEALAAGAVDAEGVEFDDIDADVEVVTEFDEADVAMGPDNTQPVDLASVLGFETDDDDVAPDMSIAVSTAAAAAMAGDGESAPGENASPAPLDELSRFMQARAASMNLDLEDAEVRETLEVEFLSRELSAQIRREEPRDLTHMGERLQQLRPDDPLVPAALGLAKYLGARHDDLRETALRELRDAQEKHAKSPDVHIAAATALLRHGRLEPARAAARRAALVLPGDPRIPALIAAIDGRSQERKGKKSGDGASAIMRAAVLALLLTGGLALVQVVLGFGAGESVFDPFQKAWYVRHGALLVFALVGIGLFDPEGFAGLKRRVRFDVTFPVLLLCLAAAAGLGAVFGVSSLLPMGLPVALGAALVHITCERFFFSVFLTDEVVEHYEGSVPLAVAVSAPLYGVYAVATYAGAWERLAWMPVGIATYAGLGAIFALVHAKTRSTVVVWLVEVTLTVTALLLYGKT